MSVPYSNSIHCSIVKWDSILFMENICSCNLMKFMATLRRFAQWANLQVLHWHWQSAGGLTHILKRKKYLFEIVRPNCQNFYFCRHSFQPAESSHCNWRWQASYNITSALTAKFCPPTDKIQMIFFFFWLYTRSNVKIIAQFVVWRLLRDARAKERDRKLWQRDCFRHQSKIVHLL